MSNLFGYLHSVTYLLIAFQDNHARDKTSGAGVLYPTELSWLILTVWVHRCLDWRGECPCTLVLAAIYWVS
jgi:hypothetical protein